MALAYQFWRTRRIPLLIAARVSYYVPMSLPKDLVIRFAVADDTPAILAFICDLAEYEKLLEHVIADEQSIRTTLFGIRPAAEVLIAELAGEAVGFALFCQTYSTFLAKPGLWLEDLFVRPAARGQGVGAALMSVLARIAVQRNYGRFEWSVLDWNKPALDFYASLGATPMSEWTAQRLTGPAMYALAERWPHPIGKT